MCFFFYFFDYSNIWYIAATVCKKPAFAGMGLTDMGTDTATGTEWAISIRTHDTCIRQPTGYTISMSNTKRMILRDRKFGGLRGELHLNLYINVDSFTSYNL